MLFNPAWRTYKYSGKRFSRPTADEKTAQSLIAALKEENIKYETYYKLLLSTGMRRGDAASVGATLIGQITAYTFSVT